MQLVRGDGWIEITSKVPGGVDRHILDDDDKRRPTLWDAQRRSLAYIAGERCEGENCRKPLKYPVGQAHHVHGKGGGKRDDRIVVPDGRGGFKRNLVWLCEQCHMVEEHNPKPCPPKPKVTSPFNRVQIFYDEAQHFTAEQEQHIHAGEGIDPDKVIYMPPPARKPPRERIVVKPNEVPCQHCGARARRGCKSGGKPTYPHPERIQAAKDEAKRQNDDADSDGTR